MQITKRRFSNSVRKFVRLSKAKIRRDISDSSKRLELIDALYKSLAVKKDAPIIATSKKAIAKKKKNEGKGNI